MGNVWLKFVVDRGIKQLLGEGSHLVGNPPLILQEKVKIIPFVLLKV